MLGLVIDGVLLKFDMSAFVYLFFIYSGGIEWFGKLWRMNVSGKMNELIKRIKVVILKNLICGNKLVLFNYIKYIMCFIFFLLRKNIRTKGHIC